MWNWPVVPSHPSRLSRWWWCTRWHPAIRACITGLWSMPWWTKGWVPSPAAVSRWLRHLSHLRASLGVWLTPAWLRGCPTWTSPLMLTPRSRSMPSGQFEFVLAHLINFQELGITWAALNDPVKLQSLKDSLMACTSRLSLERIGSLLAAVRRWHRWAVEKGVSPRAPTPLELSEFYRSVATGGPTAAASLFQAMKWFEVNYGVPFHSAHYLIQPHKFNAPSHEGRQQAELQPWEFINLLVLAARSQGTKLMLVTFLLQSASSCIRFEHFQRSTMVSSFSKWLKFKCSKGKARRQGTRPSYEWAMPDVQWQGWSLLAVSRDFLRHEAWPEASFLWPMVMLDPDDLWQIHSGTPFQVQKAMSRGRFLEIMRGILHEVGVPRAEAVAAGYNRLRRFLPTLANCLQFEPVAMQAIGSWFEIPDAGEGQPVGPCQEYGLRDVLQTLEAQAAWGVLERRWPPVPWGLDMAWVSRYGGHPWEACAHQRRFSQPPRARCWARRRQHWSGWRGTWRFGTCPAAHSSGRHGIGLRRWPGG